AADVREHLRLQREGGDGAAVLERLWRSDRRGQLDVLDPELVEELGHRDLLGGREVRVRELLALAEGRVDDRKTLDRHGYPPTTRDGHRALQKNEKPGALPATELS